MTPNWSRKRALYSSATLTRVERALLEARAEEARADADAERQMVCAVREAAWGQGGAKGVAVEIDPGARPNSKLYASASSDSDSSSVGRRSIEKRSLRNGECRCIFHSV